MRDEHACSSSAEYRSLYTLGTDLIAPHMRLSDRPEAELTESARLELVRGMSLLQQAIGLCPSDPGIWRALWTLGKACEALDENEAAYEYFRASYALNPAHRDVARELAGACMRLGRYSEALSAAEAALRIAPDDPGTVANYAGFLMLNDRLEEAFAIAHQALAMDPSDVRTQYLVELLERQRGRT